MDAADFWLLEKDLVHKLFKVLVPRYENCSTAYTRILNAPRPTYGQNRDKVILELRGNPYPSLVNKQTNNKLLIQNVLLDAAKHDYRQSKYAEMAEKMGKSKEQTSEAIVKNENANSESKVPEN
jgi:large subunit ribosomal protein L17